MEPTRHEDDELAGRCGEDVPEEVKEELEAAERAFIEAEEQADR